MSIHSTFIRSLALGGLLTTLSACSAPGNAAAPTLWGSSWTLERLGAAAALPGATLVLTERGKVAGNASCNRFFGGAEIHDDRLTVGPLGTTRMACDAALMAQEARYLALLQKARRFELQNTSLLIYTEGEALPLRLTSPAPRP